MNQPQTAIVVIGRNEAARLGASLASVLNGDAVALYVDSGSSDDSVAIATSLGIPVLELSAPFSAARARNEGLRALTGRFPALRYVQFLDGDSTLDAQWLAAGQAYLHAHPTVAIVCGFTHERYPERSLYNRLCALEWDQHTGDIQSCGGIMLVRIDAFAKAGGFDVRLIAGEEASLCETMRAHGYSVVRLNQLMAVHDAHMLHLRQWLMRSLRGGYAYAAASLYYPRSLQPAMRLRCIKILFWSLALPLGAATHPGWLALYLLVFLKTARARLRAGNVPADAALYAFCCIMDKWPQLAGMALFITHRLLRRAALPIEYK